MVTGYLHYKPLTRQCNFFSKRFPWQRHFKNRNPPTKHFFDLICSELSRLSQKSPKFYFQSQFSLSKIHWITGSNFFAKNIVHIRIIFDIFKFWKRFVFWNWALFPSIMWFPLPPFPLTRILAYCIHFSGRILC